MAEGLVSGFSCPTTAILEHFAVIDADPVRDEEDQVIDWAGLINGILSVGEV